MDRHYKELYKLLKKRPHKIGCEVGVHTGAMLSHLLPVLPKIQRYYAIDPWDNYQMYDGSTYRKPGNVLYKTWQDAIMAFFKSTKDYSHKVIMMRMTSIQGAKHIEDEGLDWVFIDANHEYEYIKENLHVWTPKVKPGGLVSGHDYKNPKGKWKGITRAVNEFVPKNKLHEEPFCVWWFNKE